MATLPRFRPRPEPEWRPLAPVDIAYIAALEAQIHAVPWTPGNFRDAIAAGYLTEAGEREGRIVAYGVMLLAPGEAQILNLSVVPDARREGLGRTLLRRFIAHATRLGAEQVFLEVRVSNTAAVALYEGEGFTCVGRREAYYPAHVPDGVQEDALVMRRELGPDASARA
jgi:ribosomal-protein-alanine N-acetyltransferase